VIVIAASPAVLLDAGLNVAVAPGGNPLVPNRMLDLKPFTMFSVTVEVAVPPGEPPITLGDADSEKLPTRTVIVWLWHIWPLVPVIVAA
jgi:hypothetical protein